MTLQVQDYLKEYESRTDEELLRLAMAREDLTADANMALTSELSRRGLSGDEKLQEFRAEEEDRCKALERDPGRLFLSAQGVGRRRYCKWSRQPAAHAGFEEFTTTVFLVIAWIPLIPTGTFRVRARKGFFSGRVQVIERLPMNWAQVVMVWSATLSVFLALALAMGIRL